MLDGVHGGGGDGDRWPTLLQNSKGRLEIKPKDIPVIKSLSRLM